MVRTGSESVVASRAVRFTPGEPTLPWRGRAGRRLLAALTVAAAGFSVASAQEGQKKWAYSLSGFSRSSPALSPDGNTIYIGIETMNGGGRVVAIPQDGGAARWLVNRTDAILSSPAVSADGSTIYIGCEDGRLYALQAATGVEKWRFDTHTFVASSVAIGADGTVYFGAGDSKLHAVTDQGAERWTFSANGWIDSSPAIAPDGTIYIGSNDNNVYAVTPDGQGKWQFTTGGPISTSPAIGADGTIYIGSSDQRLYALAPDGTKKWDFFTNGDLMASPVLGADGTVYFASFDGFFYALNPAGRDEQRVKWKTSINATTSSTAAVRGDGVIIFGTDGSKAWALEPDSGRVRWMFDAGTADLAESSPLIAPDGSIYIAFLDGSLYKLNGNGSPLSAYSSWPAFRRDPQHTGRSTAGPLDGRLVNIATRALAGGNNYLIAGFVVQDSTGTPYLVRAVGPGLAPQGIVGLLRDPVLELFSGQTLRQRNDDWPRNDPVSGFGLADTIEGVGAFPLTPGSKDAALVPVLESGVFTAQVTSADASAGVALVEVYDARGSNQNARLINLSTRGTTGSGENTLTAGFVVERGAMRLLLRGIGPGLAQFGVPRTLPRPRLELFRGQTSLASNSNWTADGFKYDLMAAGAAVSAFSLVEDRPDAAILFRASAGDYTIQITGLDSTTGEALVEIYVLP